MSKHPDREQMAHMPGLRDGIFPLWFRDFDRTSNGLFSGIVNTVDVLLHGESGRERFNPKNVLLQTGTATGTAIGAYLAASLIQERLLDRSSATIHAQELGLEEEADLAASVPGTSEVELNQPSLSLFEQRVTIERAERPIYEQFVDADGILIKAPGSVDPKILLKAKEITDAMLSYRGDIKQRLIDQNVQMVIVPDNLTFSDLPEFSSLTGRTADGREWESIRGVGASRTRPVAAIGEDRLINEYAVGIYEHEIGHSIMNLGFDDEQKTTWRSIYDLYKGTGIFGNSFASSNQGEFWAVLTQVYLGKIFQEPNYVSYSTNDISTFDQLRTVSPEAFNFLASVYGPRNPK